MRLSGPGAALAVTAVAAVVATAVALGDRGVVTGTPQAGGRCTPTMTLAGGSAVSASSEAVADATTTVCGGLGVPAPPLTGGTWTAVVTYASPTAAGASAPMTVTVP